MKYPVLIDFMQKFCQNAVCVEVGVFRGDQSEAILQNTNCKKLYCVDPWLQFDNDVYPDGINSIPQSEFNKMYKETVDRLAHFGDRQGVLRMTSVDAAATFLDNSIDFVFIDGNHEYKAVMADFRAWYPKLKKGGYFCGDDVFSTNLAEYDSDKNVTLIHTRKPDGTPDAWGKYGVFTALLDFQKEQPYQFQIAGNHFFSVKG